MKQEDRAELRRIRREWRQEIDERLKQIEADLEELGDDDLAMKINNVRHELHIRLIPIRREDA